MAFCAPGNRAHRINGNEGKGLAALVVVTRGETIGCSADKCKLAP